MAFTGELSAIKTKVDRELELAFDRYIEEAKKEGSLFTDILEHAKKITLAGGKRIRPALFYWAYVATGGSDRKKIIKAAAGLELLHMFFLLHDDIIDRADKRHGIISLNKKFEQLAIKNRSYDPIHFGNTAAIIAGDYLYSMALELFSSVSKFENYSKAYQLLQKIIRTTIIGQTQDVSIEFEGNVSQDKVLQMYLNKTARYTFEGPILLGAMLSGNADQNTLKKLSEYAIPVGITFQIQDDILGVFGDEKKMGKSTASDIEEGKRTLMVVNALENSNQNQKKIINDILGKKNLTKDEIEKIKQVIIKSGALEFAKQTAIEKNAQAKRALEKTIIKKEVKNIFSELADYIISREK